MGSTIVRRLLWLAFRLGQKREVNFLAYHARFNLAIRTYYRDLKTLEAFGFRMRSHRDHGRAVLESASV